jgi:two-component system, cell cycle sensor histidine kinase DivJ
MLVVFNVLWAGWCVWALWRVGGLGFALLAAPALVFLIILAASRRLVPAVQASAPFWLVAALGGWMTLGAEGRALLLLLPLAPLSAMIAGRGRDGFGYILLALMGTLGVWLLTEMNLLSAIPDGFDAVPGAIVYPAAVALAGLLLTASFAQAMREKVRSASGAPEVPISGVILRLSPRGRIESVVGDVALLPPGRAMAGQSLRPLFGNADGVVAWLDGLQAGERGAFTGLVADRPELRALHAWRRKDKSVDLLVRPVDARPDLEARAKAAEETLATRTTFFASLGHDLKTPLNAIVGFSDLMRQGLLGPIGATYRERSDIIHESATDLLMQVEALMDLAKSDAGSYRLDLEPVDLMDAGRSVARQLSDMAARKGVRIRIRNSRHAGWAEADARAVRLIWQNLLSNALKYSPDKAEVELTTWRDGEKVCLSVSDAGDGMTEDELKSAAQPFAQGGNAVGRPGTGLGLAIVHRLASLHGGQVRIETGPGEGTRVTVSFRSSAEQPGRATAAQAAE